jgi:hypothetical protein
MLQGVLECVVGVVERAEHPAAVRVQLGPVGFDEATKGVLVSGGSRSEQRRVRRHPLGPSRHRVENLDPPTRRSGDESSDTIQLYVWSTIDDRRRGRRGTAVDRRPMGVQGTERSGKHPSVGDRRRVGRISRGRRGHWVTSRGRGRTSALRLRGWSRHRRLRARRTARTPGGRSRRGSSPIPGP